MKRKTSKATPTSRNKYFMSDIFSFIVNKIGFDYKISNVIIKIIPNNNYDIHNTCFGHTNSTKTILSF